ncbi:cysteine-rich receptor-like protein kinase 4 [Lolium rigidum]|uniref:cysteine-rich receptor-like protein kinase 4 n=1 Tax=Lolium rigidum TaxID=89674 RepID=UPI001F5C6117|nr:cysteine-rich receptor-like protein kinase 4 [Lolium rigidum]XP_047052563.1 cysteine-rich receptor-like protein kinase 4 [Lolium rigidum]
MAIILLLLLSSLTPFQAAAQFAVFCDNVKAVAATLPNKTSSSPVHFATAIVGQAPDVVYALALCRGDILDDSTCANCIANKFEIISNATPPGVQCYGAGFYYADCTIVYNATDILGEIDDGVLRLERWNVKNVTGDVPLIAGLIHDLLLGTVEKASAAPRRFATGVVDSGTNFPKVYSLAQCTPDLSAGDCLACLRRLLGMVNSTMALRMGGQMSFIRCNFRYDASQFYQGQPMLILGPPSPLPPIPSEHKRRMSKLWAIPIVLVPLAAVTFLCVFLYSRRLKKQRKGKVLRLQGSRRFEDSAREEQLVWQGKNSDFSVFDFEQLLEATNNFSEENKLGQGGFGAVYKGKLPDGLDIAVKRLASHSGQGFTEFKNEVQLIAKLQHSNLVRLMGCCSQEEEKILVYEYLPNKSLDFFIFDEKTRALLDWSNIIAIIEGISHGLLYLHKHSRLRVIHRDLKPSNILLDNEMNPKISDFGLAKIFTSNNNEGNITRRVVGTYGYMAPEYASEGIFSIKSDVFSFGVIMFEILSGIRNSGSKQCGDFINLLGYAWQLWEEGRWADIVDATLLPKINLVKMMRYINIALLCVQENAEDRPTMTDVKSMLSSDTMILAEPMQPAYFNVRVGNEEPSTTTESCSINDMTISVVVGR